jgi:hypothetical protein
MITDRESLLELRNSLADYVKELSEELLYWMEELNRLEEAAESAASDGLAATGKKAADVAWAPEQQSAPGKLPPLS